MYSTCLYCTKDLGANEVIETLPIGRRIAFDERQGRLWVICRSCEKWNLVPFDTRLETIDACERLFRGTRVRFSTDNIGIARLPEGLELVRVGPALRPEFAAWRYGDQFGRRRIKTSIGVAAGTLAVGGAFAFGHAYIFAAGLAPQILIQANNLFAIHRVAVRHPGPAGVGGVMTSRDLAESRVAWNEGETWHGAGTWTTLLKMRTMVAGPFISPFNRPKDVELSGHAAVGAIGRILPRLNGWGGSRKMVSTAVAVVESEGGIEGVMREAAVRGGYFDKRSGIHNTVELKSVSRTLRMAMEMASHEDTERTALAGELKLLEREWQEAEELARIADDLATGDDIAADLDARKMKQDAGGSSRE